MSGRAKPPRGRAGELVPRGPARPATSRTRASSPNGVIPLSALAAHGPAFLALSAGDPTLDPYLPPLRLLAAAIRERRAHLETEGRLELWAAVEAAAARAGAPARALAAIDALRAGAPAVFTGQQPGLLGGPAFTLYKAATAIVLARRLAAMLAEPVVPLFWVASDDADFDEIASATVARPNLALETVTLDGKLREPDRMVGSLPASAGREALARARSALAESAGGAQALELAGPMWERGRDWGEGFAACLYQLLGGEGLVVVDAREPALRELARPFLARVLDDVPGFSAAVDTAGAALEGAGLGRQLGAFAAAFPIWWEEPPRRHRFTSGNDAAPAEALAGEARRVLAGELKGALWPSAALRPLVVDQVLPVVARVLGPAEVAYMAQLAPAYARLGVKLPPAVPRLTATLIPGAASRIAKEAGCEMGTLLTHGRSALEALFRRRLPRPVVEALAGLEALEQQGFARVRTALAAFGPGLEQLVDSVAGKAEYQRGRLWEAVLKRERLRSEAEDPVLRHLPAFLRPDQGLQERRLAVLGGLALAGKALVPAVLARAEEHLDALAAGRPWHYLIGVE